MTWIFYQVKNKPTKLKKKEMTEIQQQQKQQQQSCRQTRSSEQRQRQRAAITYEDCAAGTENFVNALFDSHNMEKIMWAMIKESNRQNEIGVLPCRWAHENDINEGMAQGANLASSANKQIMDIIQTYRNADRSQNKPIYITNFVVTKTNDHNHYCAFWIDKKNKFVSVWDSATSRTFESEFTKLFKQAAYLFFAKPGSSLQWATKIFKTTATHDKFSFQIGGGYNSPPGSPQNQNIYCHTWTLFYLELRVNGVTPGQIGCVRGSHWLIPLMIIKLYSQCLLRRMGIRMSKKYIGLKYVWDKQKQQAIELPKFVPYQCTHKRTKDSFCARQVVEIVESTNYFHLPKSCHWNVKRNK